MGINKRERGITLIALVVTIIVLLILAGVSISMLAGQNGILNRASEAKEKTETSGKDEQRKLAQAEALMNTEKTNYKGVTLPEGFAPTKIAGEDSIDDGLVITDGYGNEYVKVEVPKTTEVYLTAGLNITNFADEEYIKVEKDLQTYATDYRQNSSYKDEYYADNTSGWFKNNTEYNEAKKKMLKSVYQNGGFWIGRYEAGISSARTGKGEANEVPIVKKNSYPYNYITRTQAKVLAESINSGNYTSSLLFGIQWDLVMKFIETKENDSDIYLKLSSDSSTIGNYYNSKLSLNNGKFAQSILLSNWYDFNSNEKIDLVNNKQKQSQDSYMNAILLTTGATEATKLQNIYDIAGNVWEWTLEAMTEGQAPCARRSGSCNGNGAEYMANYRNIGYISDSYGDIGFRITLY